MRWLPLGLVLGVGCADYECQEIRAEAIWPADLTTLDVDLVLANIGLTTFDCATVPECVAAVRYALQPESAVPPLSEEPPDDADAPDQPVDDSEEEPELRFWPAEALVRHGATDISVALERRGTEVDVRMTFALPTAWDMDPAPFTVVGLGAPGREVPRMLIEVAAGDVLEPSAGHRILTPFRPLKDESQTESWLLPRRVRSARMVRPDNPDVVPMLAAMPGLHEALEAESLLGPDLESVAPRP